MDKDEKWMTKTTKSTESLLERAGISVGADNKLELDEDALKKALETDNYIYSSNVPESSDAESYFSFSKRLNGQKLPSPQEIFIYYIMV